MQITSLNNLHIKEVVQLKNRKAREETGLTVVDGIREVMRANEAGVVMQELYLCQELYDSRGLDKDEQQFVEKLLSSPDKFAGLVHATTKKVFQKISFGDRKEGVLAVCKPIAKTFADIKCGKKAFFIVVEKVEKPGNLGAILRTCDGAGVDALIVSDDVTDMYNPNVIRASIGAVFSVPVVQCGSERAVEYLRKKKVEILSTSPQAAKVYTKVDLNKPIAIVVGSEKDGLSDFWLEQCDVQVKIPMRGKADSLNVSTTTAIIAYEVIRQRM